MTVSENKMADRKIKMAATQTVACSVLMKYDHDPNFQGQVQIVNMCDLEHMAF